MAERDSSQISPDITYIEYSVPDIEFPAQQVITGTAITNINGLTGPNITLGGGASGFSFTPAGITITLASPLTTKGDLYGHTGAAGTRLAVGTNGQLLSADSTQTTGLKWVSATTSTTVLNSFSFNLNSGTKQVLYTVSAGKSAVIMAVVLRGPSVDLSGGATANLSAGFTGAATDWANATIPVRTLTATTQFQVTGQETAGGGASARLGAAADTFKAFVDVVFGSAATVTIDVLGYEF